MARNDSPMAYPNDLEFDEMDHADESIIAVKDDAKRQLIEAGLGEEQAEYNAQFLASGLSTFAHRAGMSTAELYRSLGLNYVIYDGRNMKVRETYYQFAGQRSKMDSPVREALELVHCVI